MRENAERRGVTSYERDRKTSPRRPGAPDRAQGGLEWPRRARVPGDSGTRVLTAVVKNNRVQRLKPNSLATHN